MNNGFTVAELRALPGIAVEVEDLTDRISIHVSRRVIPLRIIRRASGYPRDVRAAVWEARKATGKREHLMVTAPTLSPGSRKWLQSEGIAYCDEQGNLFLTSDGVYLFREGNSKQAKVGPQAVGITETNIFRGRATQILHALLHTPNHSWHVTDLATEAGVAPGTALKVCETLEKMLLMERAGRGPRSLRTLNSPGALLDAWGNAYRPNDFETHGYYRWVDDLDALAAAIGAEVERQGYVYAATLALGALRRAPLIAHTETIAILLPHTVDLNSLVEACRLPPADAGANVMLRIVKNEGPFLYRQQIDGIWVANDIQLYLDLLTSPMRGKEQAEHLRRERLGF